MTKFEEEVKRPKKAYIDPFSKRDVDFTGVAKKFTEGAQTLKEWKEYAFLLEDKLKLQQQALPVVPECVGLGISEDIQLNTVVADVLTTVITSDDKDLKEYGLWIKENLVTYVIARTLGYTVEKPQLFYLKNKIELEDVGSDLIGYLNLFLTNGGYLTNNINRAKKFTQAEIDSMQTGSYEQIEVVE